jgi:large subunit ribosomal protein L18
MDTRKKTQLRKRRHQRLRKKVHGTPERPRLAVFKSLNHFYCQAIDDSRGITLCASSSLVKNLKEHGGNSDAAVKVAENFAEAAKQAGIKTVVFDHGGFGYKGKIKKFAETLRKNGLEF